MNRRRAASDIPRKAPRIGQEFGCQGWLVTPVLQGAIVDEDTVIFALLDNGRPLARWSALCCIDATGRCARSNCRMRRRRFRRRSACTD